MAKKNLLRILLIVIAVAAIVIALPRNDRDTYTYEEGQPWRYALLTAPFDIPVYLDSTTYRHLTDSITSNFSPYIIYDRNAMQKASDRLRGLGLSGFKLNQLSRLMAQMYSAGVMKPELKKRVKATTSHTVRSVSNEDDNMSNALDASSMYSTEEACKWIIDNYGNSWGAIEEISASDVDALRDALIPNIKIDSINDEKYLNLELQSINAGQGKIRQGQRIVDRGEIITPQIYTNLRTYEEMLSKTTDKDRSHNIFTIVGQIAYVLFAFALFYFYLAVYRPKIFANIRYLTFLVSIITLFNLLAILMFESFNLGIYLTPFAAVPVMVLIFIDARTAFVSLLITVLISALIAVYQFQFIVSEITVGFMAIVSLNQLSRRSQLLRTSLVILATYCVVSLILLCVNGSNLSDIDWRMFMAYVINSLLFSLTYVLILLIEKIFGFTSAVTLVELSDINNPLLRRLSEEAPGTFQHSLQVSTLAADAAHAIGANTQLVRTGALYHDIGKLNSPIFFTENQHGINPHAGLDPETSALKIISHVTDGVAMAEKAKLPRMVSDFIREHHGKGLTGYFYNTACNNAPDGVVDKTPFSYPGPNPRSKETAVMMMADAVEAASRSLKEYTPESISALVDKIIDTQISNGMFRESPLSFSDIDKIKDTFKRRLSTIYHTRVAYPDRKKSADSHDM